MKARTEDQIISQAPIEVTLGPTKYPITPLTIKKSAAWRKKLIDTCSTLLSNFDEESNPVNMGHGLTRSLIAFPEGILNLVLDYAPNLDRAVIEEQATEEQVAAAFSAIMQVAYPFLAQLGTVNQVVKAVTQ
jgi:hypothetical protein